MPPVTESQGDVFDFVKKASGDQGLVTQFLDKVTDEDANEETLLQFFYESKYFGVSLEDCAVLLSAAKSGAWRDGAKEKVHQDY
jgi:hypothetical protein